MEQPSSKPDIRVKFVDWHNDGMSMRGDIVNNFVLNALKKHYNVIQCENPEIVFCSIYGYEFKKYDCIRVFVCLEENIPNFNIYDYAITICKGITYQDRIFSDAVTVFSEKAKELHDMALKKHELTSFDLTMKDSFCSFVQSHNHVTASYRTEVFKELSKYKKVNAGGLLLNNTGGPVANKLEFEMRHKFSLSFHNACNNTLQDRPTDAFAAKTIPIFWGNPYVDEIFNEGAFVNCHKHDDIASIIDHVKKIDNDDDLYLKMLRTPAFKNPESSESVQNRFERFLINIVENGTKQRSGGIFNSREEDIHYMGTKALFCKISLGAFLAKLFKPFKKSKLAAKIRFMLLKY